MYKGQGRSQRKLITRAYEAFPVEDQQLQLSIPITTKFPKIPGPVGQGYILIEYISVARVRPRTSKDITDLLLPQTLVA